MHAPSRPPRDRAHDDQTTGSGARPKTALWTVQWMRAAAALMVVVGHSQSAVETIARGAGTGFTRSAALPWGAGVDLFFVISGFIMVHASRTLFGQPGAAMAFLSRRLARIVPLYWLTTTLFVALLCAAALKGGGPMPDGAAILTSYVFLPFDADGDGWAFPIFDLGWTLNYEMFFYLVFAATVALPRRRAIAGILGLLVLLTIVGRIVPPTQTALHFWTRPIILDFALGIGVGALLAGRARLNPPTRIVMVGLGLLLLASDPAHVFNGPVGTTVPNEWPRVLFAGLPAALALAGAVLGPEPRHRRAFAPATRLGDASYSLYLLHPVALIVLEKLAQKSAAVRAIDGGLLVLATTAAAILLALASFRWIERPTNMWINQARRGRAAGSRTAAAAHPHGTST